MLNFDKNNVGKLVIPIINTGYGFIEEMEYHYLPTDKHKNKIGLIIKIYDKRKNFSITEHSSPGSLRYLVFIENVLRVFNFKELNYL